LLSTRLVGEHADAGDLVVTEIDQGVGDEALDALDLGEVLGLDQSGDLGGLTGLDLDPAERCVHGRPFRVVDIDR
jgi:hypothetical protein